MLARLRITAPVVAIVAFALCNTAPVDAQGRPATSGLHIVIVEGEDAVNIVQQKTAVAPVVEVRDRNDQPVAGAVVNFAVRGGRATFSGARTVSVATNVAGRATAAGFTPTASGAVQISATAAFQGQTAAITIAQTNVMTIAQAGAITGATGSGGGSAASGASAGAGGGSGGGVSATTIGIVGGAAAGGTLVATKALGGESVTTYSGQFSGTIVLPPVVGGPQSFCGFTVQITNGTLTLDIDTLDATSAKGHGKVVESGTVVYNASCGLASITYGAQVDVSSLTGSSSNFGFSAQEQNTFGPNNANLRTHTASFTGSLNGSEITGTLTLTESNAPVSGPGPAGSGSSQFSVTLNR